jgi:hypothetical protein
MEAIGHVLEQYRKMSPKMILDIHFGDNNSIIKELPIRGGWGYSKEDACVIDKNDPLLANSSRPFNGYAIENVFVKLRTDEELLEASHFIDSYILLNIERKSQSLIIDNGRKFDRLTFEVEAVLQSNVMTLRKLLDEAREADLDDDQEEEISQKIDEKTVRMTR